MERAGKIRVKGRNWRRPGETTRRWRRGGSAKEAMTQMLDMVARLLTERRVEARGPARPASRQRRGEERATESPAGWQGRSDTEANPKTNSHHWKGKEDGRIWEMRKEREWPVSERGRAGGFTGILNSWAHHVIWVWGFRKEDYRSPRLVPWIVLLYETTPPTHGLEIAPFALIQVPLQMYLFTSRLTTHTFNVVWFVEEESPISWTKEQQRFWDVWE